MHDKLNISFHQTGCPEESQIRAYSKGQLSQNENRTIEEHLIDCEMCSDYLEGLSLLSGTDELDKEAAMIMAKINSGTSKKNRLWLYATAASIFLGISLFSIIWFLPSKTNYVADSPISLKIPADKRASLYDSIKAPSSGFINNSNEVTKSNKSQADESKVISQTAMDQLSTVQLEVNEENKQAEYKTQEYWSANGAKDKEQEQIVVADSKNIPNVTSVVTEKLAKTTTDENQNMVGGVSNNRGLIVKDATGKSTGENGDAEKSEKKSDRKESDNKTGVATNAEIAFAEESPAIISKGDKPGKESDDLLRNTESNPDLDKSNVFINQQMADSAVVYALRATTSCDSCKWTAMFVLAKAYIAAGKTDKAVTTLKEIKVKAPSKYSKEAKAELQKLGY